MCSACFASAVIQPTPWLGPSWCTLYTWPPAGRARVGMLAVVVEFERDILRERVNAGIARPAPPARTWVGHRL